MNFITDATVKAVKHLYNTDITAADINLQETRREFEGQVTIVTFPFTRFSKKSPEQTGLISAHSCKRSWQMFPVLT